MQHRHEMDAMEFLYLNVNKKPYKIEKHDEIFHIFYIF